MRKVRACEQVVNGAMLSAAAAIIVLAFLMKNIGPKEAYELMQHRPDSVLIDCRSELEYLFVGHAVGAQHVPWAESPDWDVNPRFVDQVRRLAGENTPVLVMCRSGNRSVAAAEALERSGFSDVFNIPEGFEGPLDERHRRSTVAGWRKEGLPWEQT